MAERVKTAVGFNRLNMNPRGRCHERQALRIELRGAGSGAKPQMTLTITPGGFDIALIIHQAVKGAQMKKRLDLLRRRRMIMICILLALEKFLQGGGFKTIDAG